MKKLSMFCLFSISAATRFAAAAPVRMEFTIDGVKREAAVTRSRSTGQRRSAGL
jgi:precorrin-4 methylase